MAKSISLAAAAYKLVWVRVSLFFLLPAATMFVSLAGDLTDEKWKAMGDIGRAVFWAKIFIAGTLGIVAFIDQSLARAREEHKRAKSEQLIDEMDPAKGP